VVNVNFVRFLAWISLAFIAIFTLAPIGFRPESGFSPTIERFSAFAAVGLVFALAYPRKLWLAVVIGNYVDERVRISEELTPSIRVLVGKVAKIGLVLVAGTVALSAVGVDLTALTVFSGAIGVGLAFGLQKVVSNFVSGIIILLDKSIKPGDTISLEGTFGWIRELRARFVSVVTRDGREYLIPNEDFITQRVINWSFSDNLVRLDVDETISDTDGPIRCAPRTRSVAASARTLAKPSVSWLILARELAVKGNLPTL